MSLVGKTNAEKIWNFIINKTKNPYGAAGLMGNIFAESNLVPTTLEDYFVDLLNMSGEEYTEAVDNNTYD